MLLNSTRHLPKATYVPLTVPVKDGTPGRALAKFSYAGHLSLQTGEVASALHSISAADKGTQASLTPEFADLANSARV